jgi:colicin import membrane protein
MTRVHLDMADEGRSNTVMFGVSALVHLLVFLAIIFGPGAGYKRRAFLPAINVSLVGMPGGGPAPAPAAAPAPEPPAAAAVPAPAPEPAAPAAVPVPPKAPEVSVAPPPKEAPVKKALKDKTIDRQKVAREPVHKPAAPQAKPAPTPAKTSSVDSAIDALRKKVASQEKAGSGTGSGAGAGSGAGGGAGQGGGGYDRLTNYMMDVALEIERNWAFPEYLAGASQDLESIVVFRVLPNGEITDIRFDHKSGNRFLDESAYKAVVKSSPVKPHPEGIHERSVELGLRFTPAGVR